jgi:hypothetical protein
MCLSGCVQVCYVLKKDSCKRRRGLVPALAFHALRKE